MEISNLFYAVMNTLTHIWHLNLFQSGATVIQLNQVLVALGVMVIGIYFSKKFSRLIVLNINKKLHIHENTLFYAQKFIYYLFLVLTSFIALPIAGIPITVFTVLGSALAIGVGFGAQNLFNNLISGIILFVEKPIRIGDIVEVNGQEGKVEDIGNRCVRIRRFDGIDVIVPNSSFLENPVVNWTLTDSELRGDILVGVAYGSDVRQVESLMLESARSHPRILKDKNVQVFFEEFGDNALLFRLVFWTHISLPADLKTVNSDLRFKLEELFRQRQIVIAYPQRDIHVNSVDPIQVQLISKQIQTGDVRV